MKYKDFIKYYSFSRTSKYYKAVGKRKDKTMLLYYGNMKIAQSFHPLLGTLEVVLRNRLHRELSCYFDDNKWIVNQKTGFMIDPLLSRKNKKSGVLMTNDYLFREISKAENKLKSKGHNITAGRIIAEQSLGFWVSFFDLIHYKLLKGIPCKIFQKLPSEYGRKEIYDTLNMVRAFRNRINHNEPICFIDGKMDFSYARNMYRIIVDFLNWIDPLIIQSLKGLDKVVETIEKEEKKQKY